MNYTNKQAKDMLEGKGGAMKAEIREILEKDLRNYYPHLFMYRSLHEEEARETLLDQATEQIISLIEENSIVITSKGEWKRIVVQHPEFFEAVAQVNGYVKKQDILDMLPEEKVCQFHDGYSDKNEGHNELLSEIKAKLEGK